MSNFQTCTICYLNMIVTIKVLSLKMNVVQIIGKMMCGSCIRMPLVSSMLMASNKKSMRWTLRGLILVREIKTMIAFKFMMTRFEAYLTNKKGICSLITGC